MAKKTIYPGTQDRKNKVLKSNQISTNGGLMSGGPGKSPTSVRAGCQKLGQTTLDPKIEADKKDVPGIIQIIHRQYAEFNDRRNNRLTMDKRTDRHPKKDGQKTV